MGLGLPSDPDLKTDYMPPRGRALQLLQIASPTLVYS